MCSVHPSSILTALPFALFASLAATSPKLLAELLIVSQSDIFDLYFPFPVCFKINLRLWKAFLWKYFTIFFCGETWEASHTHIQEEPGFYRMPVISRHFARMKKKAKVKYCRVIMASKNADCRVMPSFMPIAKFITRHLLRIFVETRKQHNTNTHTHTHSRWQ